jgi:type III polyketide synthase
MSKILAINEFTGIETRSAVGTVDHPMANWDRAPTISELCKFFLKEGVALAVTAAEKAIAEAGIDISQITHVVSTTCTNSANPGFDHFVCKGLGISHAVEKVLLHGIGCSGGLAALRTAANLALGQSFRGRPARVLVIALEISSLLARSELDSINELQETRIGVTLFSDCASSLVLSNGIGAEGVEEPIYDLLGWDHRIIPDTEDDLGFEVDPLGLSTLFPRVLKCGETDTNRLESYPVTASTETHSGSCRAHLQRSTSFPARSSIGIRLGS